MADYHRDRRDYSSNNNYYGGGGGGSGRGRGGRGGGFRGRGRGGGRNNYNGGGGRGGGGFSSPYNTNRRPPQGNRFAANDQTLRDPKEQVLQSLTTMVHAVGAVPGSANTTTRVQQQAENTQSLTSVLVGSNASMFFENDASATQLQQVVGPLASSLVHAASLWPVQGPCYAALTLCISEHANQIDSMQQQQNFASRVVQYAVPYLARDLDSLLLVSSSSSSSSEADLPRTMVRVRLTLQYLMHLAQVNILQTTTTNDNNDEEPVVVAANNSNPVSLAGLLQALVQAALQACDRYQNVSVASVLIMMVFNAVPFLVANHTFSVEWIQENLMEPLERIVQQVYQSDFQPGLGRTAILMKGEQMEDVLPNQGEEQDDEEDDDDDDDDQASSPVCDSLQDLLRSVQHLLQQGDDASAKNRFTVFSDAPWSHLQAPAAATSEATSAATATADPLVFTQEPAKISIFPHCKSLTMLLGGDAPTDTELAKINLDGLVFGRLPIFGPPPDVNQDDDDDDMDDSSPSNERLDAYKKEFGLVDRYFLAQAVRDVVLIHESFITDAGVEQGSAKAVAELVWSLSSALSGDNDAKGIEYSILETLLSLVVQASPVSPFRLLYLCRIILEVTRLAPAVVSPAIALAVGNLFQDYMPALVPSARYSLSQWFAFHLINTDYQWPAAYWKHWEPFVMFGWRNSRGAFVKGALAIMAENLGNPELLITDCLPKDSALVDHILASRDPEDPDTHLLESLVNDIKTRIWENSEDPGLLLSYLSSDEVAESAAATLGDGSRVRASLRTHILSQAALAPADVEYNFIQRSIEIAKTGNNNDAMEEDVLDDSLAKVLDTLRQYKEAFVGALGKDAIDRENDVESEVLYLLEKFGSATSYSRALQEGCVRGLLQEEIVRPLSVLRWCLGEATQKTPDTAIVRWWEIVTMTFQFVFAKLNAGSDESMAMAQEGDDEPAHVKQCKELLKEIEPLLSYTVSRVCTLIPRKDNGSSKLSPEQVDLVEGLKFLVLRIKVDCFAAIKGIGHGNSKKRREVETVFSESITVKKAMASLGIDSGNATAGLLHCWRILENMD